MILSLDTTVLIDVINGRSQRVRRLYAQAKTAAARWVISSIAYHELLLGGAIRGRLETEKALLHRVFGEDPVAPFTAAHAQEAAIMRSELRRLGTPVEGYDVLIAAQARAEGWALATGNLKHFTCMPNLVVEDWSA